MGFKVRRVVSRRGTDGEAQRLLRRARAQELCSDQLELAARLGDPAAAAALEQLRPEDELGGVWEANPHAHAFARLMELARWIRSLVGPARVDPLPRIATALLAHVTASLGPQRSGLLALEVGAWLDRRARRRRRLRDRAQPLTPAARLRLDRLRTEVTRARVRSRGADLPTLLALLLDEALPNLLDLAFRLALGALSGGDVHRSWDPQRDRRLGPAIAGLEQALRAELVPWTLGEGDPLAERSDSQVG